MTVNAEFRSMEKHLTRKSMPKTALILFAAGALLTISCLIFMRSGLVGRNLELLLAPFLVAASLLFGERLLLIGLGRAFRLVSKWVPVVKGLFRAKSHKINQTSLFS